VRAMLNAAGFTAWRKFGIGRHYDMLAERPLTATQMAQRVA